MDQTPRGIRNNNPGNVKLNPAILWRGQSGVDEQGFLKFKDAMFGVRCMAMILRHYREYNHCYDLHDYINEWAPPSENDTEAYVDDVASRLGVNTYAPFNLDTHVAALIKAIIWHENGEQPYADTLIDEGIHLSHIQ